MSGGDAKHHNELLLRDVAEQAARISQNYSTQAQATRDNDRGAARLADDAERLYLEFVAECHQRAADPPTEPLTRAELWNQFMRRAQGRGVDAEAGPWLDW